MFGKNENKIKRIVIGVSLAIFAALFLVASRGENASVFPEGMERPVDHVAGRVIDYELIPPSDHSNWYSQELIVEILSGDLAGVHAEIFHAMPSPLFPHYEVGDPIVVTLHHATDLLMADGPNRSVILIGFVVLFLALLCIIGGKRGVLSVFGLIFALLSITWILVPLTLQGYSSILIAFIVAVLITLVGITLLAGVNAKSLSAIAGCIFGVASAALLAFIVGNWSFITGYHAAAATDARGLINLADIRVSGIFVSGVIISALGAIMDTSVTIASSMEEVKRANPLISAKELFKSGLNVGRDAMGTMSNTLILAFVGSSFALLLIIFASEVTFFQFINHSDIGVEIIQSIAGSIGIVLTVPFTTLIAAKLFSMKPVKE
ncbi:MAG: YibE/F family protein [Turicibacter sp.]|nr:YibE/F family protein [Turicibacter sp.]